MRPGAPFLASSSARPAGRSPRQRPAEGDHEAEVLREAVRSERQNGQSQHAEGAAACLRGGRGPSRGELAHALEDLRERQHLEGQRERRGDGEGELHLVW